MNDKAKTFGMYAGVLVALIAAWVGLGQLGIRPALNGEVDAAEARVAGQVHDLSKFSVGTRILTLQADRRYYGRLLAEAKTAHRASPSEALAGTVREYRGTLLEVQRQIDQLRKE